MDSITAQTTTSNPQAPAQVPTERELAISQELGHITQEIYKKNAELAHTNRTLLVLRKIDEIILSAVTDPQLVAQQVADAMALEAEYKYVSIFLFDELSNVLVRFGVSHTPASQLIEDMVSKRYQLFAVSLIEKTNLLVKSFLEKQVETTENLSDIYSFLVNEDTTTIKEGASLRSLVVYPLIVRAQIIGVMVIGIDEQFDMLSAFQKDLMNRLSSVVGIAVDNALLYQRIQTTNDKLKQLDKLKDEFVSLASHELRTPMTAIKSYLWMALKGKGGPLTEKQKYYLERSYNSTERLIKLVNEMLNVSRIESGRITIDLKEVDITKLADDTVNELLPRAQELGIHLMSKHDAQIPHVLADENKIKEVLINLIGNSLKFTPKDGSIVVTIDSNITFVSVSVADNGKGIAGNDMKKLFQKFGMVDNNYMTKQNVQGSGLGLYISKSIVELHGGKIWADSEGSGKGSTFTFTLKAFDEKDPALQVKQPVKEKVDLIPTQV